MEKVMKKRQIKLSYDDAMLLSGRILKDSFNGLDKSFFIRELTVDQIQVLSMEVSKLSDFVNALELLKPAYFKKIRSWLRVCRSRANPNVETRADLLTTMNLSKRNLWSIDECVVSYNHKHKGANINRDELLALMISNYKTMCYM